MERFVRYFRIRGNLLQYTNKILRPRNSQYIFHIYRA